MAAHSSILAWRIPWTEEPGGLQSIGLQRVVTLWTIAHEYTWTEHMNTHSYYTYTFFFRFSSIIGYYKILKIVSCAIQLQSRSLFLFILYVVVFLFSCPVVSDSAIPETVAHQVLLSIGFFRQEQQSGLPFLPPGDLLNPGIEPTSPVSPALQVSSLPLSHWGISVNSKFLIYPSLPHFLLW